MNNTNYTLEEALLYISKLEEENAKLREKLTEYENRLQPGRKKHDTKWMANYELFEDLYIEGKSVAEIVERTNFSRRTVYRYKEYYDRIKQIK